MLKKKAYKIDDNQKPEIINKIKSCLEPLDNVLFAVIFGSFLEYTYVHDIDIAIYFRYWDLDELLKISSIIEDRIEIPIDIIPLNELSPTFKYKILTKGRIIIEKIPGLYEHFIMNTLDELIRLRIVQNLQYP